MRFKTYNVALSLSAFLLTNASASDDKVTRILSIGSEGGKSFIPAVFLNKLEKSLGSPIHEHFDLIVADGGASIISVALGMQYSTLDVINMFREHGEDMYKKHKGFAKSAFCKNKFSSKSYEKFLNAQFADADFSKMAVPMAILAHDEVADETVTFSSSVDGEKLPSVVDMLKATTSSKGNIKTVELDDEDSGKSRVFSNSEQHQKDILLSAFEEAKKQFPQSKKFVFVNIEDDSQESHESSKRIIQGMDEAELIDIRIRNRSNFGSHDLSKEAKDSMEYSVEDYIEGHRNTTMEKLLDELDTTSLTKHVVPQGDDGEREY